MKRVMNKFIKNAFILLVGVVSAKESSANASWHRWWKPELSGKYTTDSMCRIGHHQNMSGLDNEDWVAMYQSYISGQTVKNEHMIRMNKHRAQKGLGPVTADEAITLLKNGCTFAPIKGMINVAYVDDNGNIGYQQRYARNGEWGCYYEGEFFYSMDCGQTGYPVSASPTVNSPVPDMSYQQRSDGNTYVYVTVTGNGNGSATADSKAEAKNETPTETVDQTDYQQVSNIRSIEYQQLPAANNSGTQCCNQGNGNGLSFIERGLEVAANVVILWDFFTGRQVRFQQGDYYDPRQFGTQQQYQQYQINQGWLRRGNPVPVSGGNAGGPQNVTNTFVYAP